MYPKLFEIGPVPVYSYGLMLGIAFLVGSTLFSKELRRNKFDENIGIVITFLALIGGIVGAKVFYVIEEWNFGNGLPISSFLNFESLISAAGLTFYGGLIFAIIFIVVYCKIKKLSVLRIFDFLSPGAAIGYGIARIGCHLSGDGDYGTSVNGTFWEFIGYSYSNGTVPTLAGVLVHPTPIYEFVAAILIFLFLWNQRKKIKYVGETFYYYLLLTGISRLLIEFMRLNPKVILNLTQAQIVSIIMILCAFVMIFYKTRRTSDRINISTG
jgi:phosphatidylglycerol:prolipoprotein diacylglycerol transferase